MAYANDCVWIVYIHIHSLVQGRRSITKNINIISHASYVQSAAINFILIKIAVSMHVWQIAGTLPGSTEMQMFSSGSYFVLFCFFH